MAGRLEAVPAGYPGFEMMRPPRPAPTPAALKRIARAKLTGIVLFSAAFRGERFLFGPWLTLFVDYAQGMFLAGVYRTEPEETPGTPRWCLRRSEWIRGLDHERSSATSDLRGYLTRGPQVANRFVFADRATHPEVDAMMAEALTAFGPGVSIAPAERRHEWHEIELDVADDRLNCQLRYSPLLAKSEVLELALPRWLDRLDELLRRDGLVPDGEVRISIQRSVPELVSEACSSAA